MSQKSQKVESNPQPAASPRQQTAFLKQWKQLVAEGVPRRKDVAEVLRRFRAAAPVSTHVSTNANSEKEERPPNQRIQSKMNDETKENPITWRDTWKPWTLRSGHCTEDCPVRKPQPSRDGVDGRTIPITWRDTGGEWELRTGYCTESCPVAASIRKKEREKQERKRIENREKRANLVAVRDKIKAIGTKAEKAVSGFKVKKKRKRRMPWTRRKTAKTFQHLQNRNNWLEQHKWSTNHMKHVAATAKNRKNIETVEYRPNGTSYKAKEVKVGGRRRKSRKNLKKNSGKGGKRRKTRRKRKRKKRRTKRR